MDLLDEESHRLLLWAVRLQEVGHLASRRELRRVAEPRGSAQSSVVTALTGRDTEFREGAITSLIRRGLLEEIGDRDVAPTELGRSAVQVLELEGEAQPLFEVLDVDLRSGDPLAFARIVGRVASMHRPMVVDPYCRRAELEYLLVHTSVTRVLVSDRLAPDEVDELVDAVRSVRRREAKLRLRMGPAEELRDRCVISGDRVVQVGGLPHPSGAGTTVLVETNDLGAAACEHYRSIWRSAERLATYRPGRNQDARVA